MATMIGNGRRPSAAVGAHRDFFESGLAFACLASLLFLNIALPSAKLAAVNLRGALSVGLLLLLSIMYSNLAARALKKHLLLIGLAVGLAVEGTFVSLVNGAPSASIVQAVTEVHLQAVITLLVAAILVEISGPKAAMVAIVGVTAVSGFVAVLQMIDLDFAWHLRDAIGSMQGTSLVEDSSFLGGRPMGLAYSPIQFATQLCLAFAVFTATRDKERRRKLGSAVADPAVILALLVFVAACITSGNRSPILGGLIFLALYAMARQGSWVTLFIVLAGALVYFAWPTLMAVFESAHPRVVRVNDASAEGRITLAYYGLRLFLDNPLGYGFDFKPYAYWTQYWQDLYELPSPAVVQSKILHNYVLSMLNFYGIGLLLFAPLISRLLARAKTSLLFFVPYIVHILFHNSGPLWNDAIIWFVIAVIAATPGPVTGMAPARLGGRARYVPVRPASRPVQALVLSRSYRSRKPR